MHPLIAQAAAIRELTDIGFSPVSAALIVALVAVVGVVVYLHRKTTRDREAWHAETRGEVEKMQGHVTKCDEDREELRVKHARLEERIDRLTRCPRKDCPMRLP